jgi:lysophospholipase L1-like esterase
VPAVPDLARLHLPEPADPKLPSVFLIGDSTVRNGGGDGAGGQWGWGEPLAARFDPAKANLVNRAVGGLSSRTFYTGVYWRRVLDMLKPGDFVVMQFGHNDSGALDGPQGSRVSLPGTGEETKQSSGANGAETVHTYGWYLRQFIREARAKGATPIVCSLVPRKIWRDGKVVRNTDGFAGWAAEVARAEGAPFLDLNSRIADEYDRLGAEKVEPLFADEHTHTSLAGAQLNAAIVAAGIRDLKDAAPARHLAK